MYGHRAHDNQADRHLRDLMAYQQAAAGAVWSTQVQLVATDIYRPIPMPEQINKNLLLIEEDENEITGI